MIDSTGALRSLFGRSTLYVGQSRARDRFLDLVADVRAAQPGTPSCRALYLEIGGGFGKTHFLNSIDTFLGNHAPDLKRGALIGPRVDMADFESLIPTTIEETIIVNLRQQQLAAPPSAAERAYWKARENYFKGRTSSFITRTNLAKQRRRAFAACLNAFNQMGLLVLRFDTLERLFLTIDAPPQALVKTRLLSRSDEPVNGPDRFLHWLAEILPALDHTVVIFAGRPLPIAVPHPLITTLERIGVMSEASDRVKLNKLSDLDDLNAFLEAMDIPVVDEASLDSDAPVSPVARKDLPGIIELTDGSPLLLTAWVGLYKGWPDQLLGVDSPTALSELIADLLFNPSREVPLETEHGYSLPTDLAYVYAILYYTRRGITREDLAAILKKKGLFEADTDADAKIRVLLDEITKHAWVIEVSRGKSQLQTQPLLLLHDELWRIADESQNPRRFGLAGALDDLAELCRGQLSKAWEAELDTETVRPLSDYLFYALWRDFDTGYRFYTVYVDRALRLRLVEEALMLAEIFWSVQQSPLFRDRLSEALFLNEASILREEAVRQLRLLRALDEQPDTIRDRAHTMYVSFAGQPLTGQDDLSAADREAFKLTPNRPLFLHEHSPRSSGPPVDPQLFVELALVLSWVLMLAPHIGDANRAESLLKRVIELLESEAALETTLKETYELTQSYDDERQVKRDDMLILLRRSALLGQAHLALGQLYHYEQRYHLSIKHAAFAEEAFERYQTAPIRVNFPDLNSDSGEPGRRIDDYLRFHKLRTAEGGTQPRPSPLSYFCDNIDPELAQARNNLAYAKARVGDFADAMYRVEALRQQVERPASHGDGDHLSITPWQQVLLVNTRAQIMIDWGLNDKRLKQARAYVDEAVQLLFDQDGRPLVSVGRVTGLALLTRGQVEHAELLCGWEQSVAHSPEAIDARSFRQAIDLLRQDRRGLIEAHYARVRFLRSMGMLAARLRENPRSNPALLKAIDSWLARYLASQEGEQQLDGLRYENLQIQTHIRPWSRRPLVEANREEIVAEIGADVLCWCLALAEWHETYKQMQRPPEQNSDSEQRLLKASMWATLASLHIWLDDLNSAERCLKESQESLGEQQMPSFGQVVQAKVAFQYGLMKLHEQGEQYRDALFGLLTAFARSRLFSSEGRERIAFERLLGEALQRERHSHPGLFDQLSRELATIRTQAPPAGGSAPYSEVKLNFQHIYYQHPPMDRWPLVWSDALNTVEKLLTMRGR